MTVPTEISKSGPYAGAGTTGPFVVDFPFLEDGHLRVVKTDTDGVDTVLTLNVDYTVSGAGGSSGTVTLTDPLAVGEMLTIVRSVPVTQEADYVPNDPFPAQSHERALDKLTMIAQQHSEILGRVLQFPESLTGLDPVLPRPDPGKALVWNQGGTGIRNSKYDADAIADAAAQSAADALQSAQNAAQSAADADATYKDFDKRYLGEKPSDPSVDNEGNPLQEGALYWNTTTKAMRVWTGTQWTEFSSMAFIPATFSGDDVETEFTLPVEPLTANNVFVSIGGVDQTGAFTISGSTLIFDEAPPAGTDNIRVRIAQPLPVNSVDAANVQFVDAGGDVRSLADLAEDGATLIGLTTPAGGFSTLSTYLTQSLEVQLQWFYDVAGDWDDALDAAVAFLSAYNGGTLMLPYGRVRVARNHLILKPIIFKGRGQGASVLEVDDGVVGLEFGRQTNPGPRTDVVGGGVRDCTITTTAGQFVRGHISQMYGSSNPTFGFTSITTDSGGVKKADGSANITNVGVRVAACYAPFTIENVEFLEIGMGVEAWQRYGILVRSCRMLWCNVGVKGTDAITTLSITNNTIERCAVGVWLNYPCSAILIAENVIEANYAGCDILLFNSGDDVKIVGNYFEASPYSVVARADSGLQFAPHRLYFERNKGLKVHFRMGTIAFMYFKNNWINEVNFDPFVGGQGLRDIVFEDNFDGPSDAPMNVNTRLVFNSVALPYAKYIEYRGNVTGTDVATTALAPLTKRRTQMFYVTTSAASATAFSIRVPAATVDALLKITALKFRKGVDRQSRSVEWICAVKRLNDTTGTVSEISVVSDTPFTATGSNTSSAPPTPSVAVSGNADAEQTLAFNIINNSPGGNTAEWMLEVEMISSHMGVSFA